MNGYLETLRAFWRANVAEEMQYRANFLASLAGTVFWMAMALLTLEVFFRQTRQLGGWNYWEVVVLLGVFNALGGVVEAVLRPSIGRLVSYVRTGSLDLILAKPVDAQFFVSLRRLNVYRVTDIVLGLAVSVFGLFRLGQPPGVLQIAAFLVTLLSAVAVIYAIWLALMSLAFWLVAVENLSVLFDAFYEGARYPISAYPGSLRFVFTYLVPIAWTTTLPASTVTQRLPPTTAGLGVAAALVALIATRILWRHALRHYTSAGG